MYARTWQVFSLNSKSKGRNNLEWYSSSECKDIFKNKQLHICEAI